MGLRSVGHKYLPSAKSYSPRQIFFFLGELDRLCDLEKDLALLLAMGFFSGCCKWLLFIFNFLVFVLSCAGLGLGIWILVDKSSFVDLLEETDHTIHIYE